MPASTRFPLGVFVGNPHSDDAAAESKFQTDFNNFVSVMGGARPTTMNAFVDFWQDPSQWAGNAAFTAGAWAKSPVVGTSITPIIGIPMSDNKHWAGNAAGFTNDDFFKGIINGSYDAAYSGIVDSWANAGFKTMELRLGWEMEGSFMPWFMGNDSATQGDWVKAFQHLSTLMRAEAKADGVTAKVVWNPGSATQSKLSIQAAYAGDAYVDVISIDNYSPLYPKGYYDWAKNDGTVYPDKQTWWADPINREHFWSHPNGDQYYPNGRDNGFGIEDAIAMAKAHGKSLALSETGAGGDGTTTGPLDEAVFPKWLAGELASAEAQGVAIDHVNIWDARLSDGNWDFSTPNGGKPLEAAAWAKYFGAGSNGGTTIPPVIPPVVVGSGVDTLVLNLSEDAYQGNAQFSVAVDGTALGAAQAVTALHGQGQSQAFTFKGNFGSGPHTVGVSFLNDAWGGTAATDRNLYIDSATFNGSAAQGAAILKTYGTTSFAVIGSGTPPPSSATATDTLQLSLAEDAWQGDAQAVITVDGKTVGSTVTVTALQAQGKSQAVTLTGQWGAGAHDIGIQFINDAYGGTPTTDRNLYVNGVSFDGQASATPPAALYSNGTAHFAAAMSPLVLRLSEDAYLGDAQFSVAVDGKTLGGTQAVTALHGTGATQNFAFGPAMTAGTHDIAVSFLNDSYDGSAATDRNLYVDAVIVNGKTMPGTAAALLSTSTQHFSVVVAAT